MPLIVTVQRGFTFSPVVPWNTDDLNAAALPVVVIEGAVGSGDLAPGAVNSTHATPGPWFYADATGSAGAYALTLNPPAASLVKGLWVCFLANHTNSGAAALNVNGLGAKAVLTPAGNALTGGEIQSGQLCWVQYDGTQFQLTSDRSMPKGLYAVDAGASNAYAITLPGIEVTSLTSLLGLQIIFRAGAANTGASTLNVNGLGAQPITKQGATALSANDIQTGGLVSVAWDGSGFQITSFVQAPALPSVGSVGTQLYPYSMTVDSQGRVTGKAGGVYSAAVAVPAKGAAATFTHGLGRTPAFVQCVFVALPSPENGFTAGDEVDAGAVFTDNADNDNNRPSFAVTRNGTTINVSHQNSEDYMATKSGNGNSNPFNAGKWQMKVYAW